MNINRQAWFKQAIKKERWKEPGWIVKLFCVTELENVNDIVVSSDNTPPPYELYADMKGVGYCYWDDEANEFIPFDGTSLIEPFLKLTDRITLNPGDLPNVKQQIETNLGNVIINLYCCIYAFGDKLPFFTGKLSGDEIQAVVIEKATKDQNNPQPGEITPAEITQYKKAVSALAAFSMICCPTASRASMTVRKEILTKRDDLFAKHAHEIDDPAVVAEIEKELLTMDKELNKGDVSDGFFGPSSKLRNVGRKRQKIMYGVEGGLDGKLRTIPKSLAEGMDYSQLPVYADTITAASQSRGLLTAQGGELVKYNLRMFQNTLISEEDCGTKGYLEILVSKDDYKWLENRRIFVNGKTVTIAKDSLKSLIGTTIKLRSPGYCLTKDRNYCKACVDSNLAARPDGVAVAASAGASKIMMDAMKAMHGRVNDNFEFDLSQYIS